MCNSPDHMFQDHNLDAKSQQPQKSRQGIFGVVSAGKKITRGNRNNSLTPIQSERTAFVSALLSKFPGFIFKSKETC